MWIVLHFHTHECKTEYHSTNEKRREKTYKMAKIVECIKYGKFATIYAPYLCVYFIAYKQ